MQQHRFNEAGAGPPPEMWRPVNRRLHLPLASMRPGRVHPRKYRLLKPCWPCCAALQ